MTAHTLPATDPLGGYVLERQVGFLLRRAHQRHAALFLDKMAPLDLTPTQFSALVKIAELGRVGQNQLGRLTAMDPATIQGVVRRLMARALVRRTADPIDRRALVLAPTDAGHALVREALSLARDISAATLAPLSPDERRDFLALLNKVV